MSIYRGYDIEHTKDGYGKLSWRVSKGGQVQCWQHSEDACMAWVDLTRKQAATAA